MANNDIICYYVGGFGSENNKDDEKYVIDGILDNIKIDRSQIKYKTHTNRSALLNISKQLVNISPLRSSNFVYNLAYEIIEDLQLNKRVFVFGHSFGGMIVNRTAETIQTIFDNKPIDRSNLKKKINDKINKNDNGSDNNNLKKLLSLLEAEPDPDLDKILLEKLQIATFGSIYFAKRYEIDKLKIYNYISSSDPANACNGLKKQKKLPFMLKHDLYGGLIYADIQEKEKIPYIIQICLYNVLLTDNTKLCLINKKNEVCDRNRLINWKEHIYYNHFMHVLLVNRDVNIYKTPLDEKNENSYFFLEKKTDSVKPVTRMIPSRKISRNTSRKSIGGKTKKRKTKNKRVF
jgi:hypothetical protein